MPPAPQLPDGTIPLSIYEIELEQLAQDIAEKIRKYGDENVSVYESDATPEQLSAELETYKGKRYDVEREAQALEQGIDVSELIGGSTGDAALDRELLELQKQTEAPTPAVPPPPALSVVSEPEPEVVTYTSDLEDVAPDDALTAMMAEMDSLGL